MKEELEKLKIERKLHSLQSNLISEVDTLLKMVELVKNIYGEESDEYILILNEYAGASKYIGDGEKGLLKIKEAKDIISKKYGKDTVMYATTLLNETEIYRYLQKLENLEENYLKVLEIYEKNNMQSDYEYAGLCNNLGLYYQAIFEYEKAINYHNKSLNILKTDLYHKVEYATTLNNMVEPLKKLKNKELALKYLNEALEIYDKKLGKNHGNYASTLNNLAIFYMENQEYEKAYEILKKSLKICKKTFGENSLNYNNVLENIQFVEKLNIEKIDENSNAIKIIKEYTNKFIIEEIKKIDEDILNYIAIGLFGSGSECNSYDDKISKDHDFTLLPIILIKDSYYDKYSAIINDILDKLPKEYLGLKLNKNEIINSRRGLHKFKEYIYSYLGNYEIKTISDWINTKEQVLLELTNGEVFIDKSNFLYDFRNSIMYYPDDILKYKIANLCYKIHQTGQYNLIRIAKRKEKVALNLCLNEFINNIIEFTHILNKEYTPFYKWRIKSLINLEILGKEIYSRINNLLDNYLDYTPQVLENKIFEICSLLIDELKKQYLLNTNGLYMYDYIEEIISKIENENIRKLNIWSV